MIKKTKFIIMFVLLITLLSNIFISNSASNSSYAFGMKGLTKKSIYVNGANRTFYVYTPLNYKCSNKPLPVVIVLHGVTANGRIVMHYTKYNLFADKYNFIAVFPNKNRLLDWDTKSAEKSKDITFIKELINYLGDNYKVDKSRIYSTGYSSGGDFSILLACSIPDKIAAFAPVGANMRKQFIPECKTGTKVSMLMINGTKDPFDKWKGDGKNMLSVEDSLKFWLNHNHCQNLTIREIDFPHKSADTSTEAKLIVSQDSNNSEVSLLEIVNGGHTWPGESHTPIVAIFAGRTNYDVNANDVMWEFFSRHKLN